MSRFGRNIKLTIDRAHRDRVRATFEALGAKSAPGPAPGLDLFLIEGIQIGAFFVDAEAALSPADQRKGAWLEFLVPDVEAWVKRLEEVGAERLDYVDKEHPYFQIPGGPVFRLARE
jgi:hypothetical protein